MELASQAILVVLTTYGCIRMPTPQIPSVLVSRPIRVVRPRDLKGLYVNPSSELARLEEQGAVRRVARGYYALVPAESMGQREWRPSIEALALGVAVADYGADRVALMGPSAARLHGALPRALALGSVAIPKQRPPLKTRWGRIGFHTRDVSRLDLERVDTDLAAGYQTTVEQTILDLARWADTWDVSIEMIVEAIAVLAGRANWSLTRDLALKQGERAAYVRASWVAYPVVPDVPSLRVRGLVKSHGLRPARPVPAGRFPIEQ